MIGIYFGKVEATLHILANNPIFSFASTISSLRFFGWIVFLTFSISSKYSSTSAVKEVSMIIFLWMYSSPLSTVSRTMFKIAHTRAKYNTRENVEILPKYGTVTGCAMKSRTGAPNLKTPTPAPRDLKTLPIDPNQPETVDTAVSAPSATKKTLSATRHQSLPKTTSAHSFCTKKLFSKNRTMLLNVRKRHPLARIRLCIKLYMSALASISWITPSPVFRVTLFSCKSTPCKARISF